MVDMTVTYIIRFHDVSGLDQLVQAVVSVLGQSYEAVKVLIAAQSLPDKSISKISHAMDKSSFIRPNSIEIHNFEFEHTGDHRSALINHGLNKISSRFVAFLDFDDVIYPNHATSIIKELAASPYALMWGRPRIGYYKNVKGVSHCVRQSVYFHHDRPVLSLLKENHIPLNAYIVDLKKLAKVPLFWEQNNANEDYVFLLRVMQQALVSPIQSTLPVCEYRRLIHPNPLVEFFANRVYSKRMEESAKKVHKSFIAGQKFLITPEQLDAYVQWKLGAAPENQHNIELVASGPIINGPVSGFLTGLVAAVIKVRRNEAEYNRFLTNPKAYLRDASPTLNIKLARWLLRV